MTPLSPAEYHFNVPTLELNSVTVVFVELTGATKVISVVPLDHSRRQA